MTTRRIEITEETGVKLGRIAYAFGDVVTVDAEIATMMTDAGWAKDAVTGEQGVRKPCSTKLEVQSVVQKIAAL